MLALLLEDLIPESLHVPNLVEVPLPIGLDPPLQASHEFAAGNMFTDALFVNVEGLLGHRAVERVAFKYTA